jgi:glucose dehydrogenase
MRRVVESDVCIIGSGITAAMVAEKLAAETSATITVVEAGGFPPPPADRPSLRERYRAYGENPWPDDHVEGQSADRIQSRSMLVGGLAMHWGGVTPRYSPEDFRTRSEYGIGTDWPIGYEDLEPQYVEAERRLGVSGEQGPPELDPRSEPYPMPPLPLSWNLVQLKAWAAKSGIPFWAMPSAKNSEPYGGRPACCRNDTCDPVCPIGAKYSPDFTWRALLDSGRVQLVTGTLVRRLVVEDGGSRIAFASAAAAEQPDVPVEFHARAFVVACGYVWSSHLLLLSASTRYPQGLANRSGLVGGYMTGHRNVSAFVRLPMRLYPGMNVQHSLVSKRFMRPGRLDRYVRHDLRVWESGFGAEPRLRAEDGSLLLGDAFLDDWRRRADAGRARLRAYYDVIPDRSSGITLDASNSNRWGDPMPAIAFRDSDASRDLRAHTEDSIRSVFGHLVKAGGGEILQTSSSSFQDHPVGGCRMGDDPDSSVCDSHGRTHDHENLFVVGAPTCVSGSCANGTLTFAALSLRSAGAVAQAFQANVPA